MNAISLQDIIDFKSNFYDRLKTEQEAREELLAKIFIIPEFIKDKSGYVITATERHVRDSLSRYDGVIRDSFDLYLKQFDSWGVWCD